MSLQADLALFAPQDISVIATGRIGIMTVLFQVISIGLVNRMYMNMKLALNQRRDTMVCAIIHLYVNMELSCVI